MKKFIFTALVLAVCSGLKAQTYSHVALSGFNADVIANGSGSAMSSTNNAVDNSDFAFVAQNFVNPSNQSPNAAGSLPNNGTITSAIAATPGLTFQLASYTGNNTLRIASGASGTVTLTTPLSASDLYVLLTPVAYSGTCNATITVNFTDGTSQAFSGIVLNNWFGSSGAAYSGSSRVKRTTNVIEANPNGPKMFQQKLTLSAANASKLIQSILVNHTSAVSTNNVLHVMAVTAASTLATDAGITAISAPASGCVLTNQETITVTVKNYGTTAQSNIPVSYTINGGTPVNEVIAGPIAPNSTASYSFTTKANLSTAATYNLEVRTNLTGDQAPANDAMTRAVVLSAAPAAPTVTAGGPTTICSGSSVTLTAASATPGVTFGWYKNGVVIANATSATYQANAAGSYTAVASLNGCSSAASSATAVTVNTNPPAPGVNVTGSLAICSGDSVALTATSAVSGATFSWFKNGNIITGANSATYMAKTAGSYTATATNNGCVSAASVARAVTVKQTPPTPTITKNANLLVSSSTSGNQWYKDGVAIPGATVQSLNASSNGAYTVKVTSNGCTSAASNAITIANTGIKEDMAGLALVVYPNPSDGVFYVALPEKISGTLLVTDLAGKVLLQRSVKGGQAVLDLKNTAKGIYLLQVKSETGIATRKLVVE